MRPRARWRSPASARRATGCRASGSPFSNLPCGNGRFAAMPPPYRAAGLRVSIRRGGIRGGLHPGVPVSCEGVDEPPPCAIRYAWQRVEPHRETMMRQGGMSVSGLSITFALLLALWEVYFFGFAGEHLLGSLDGTIGFFAPERLGFNMAWLAWGYLSFQLISIPFALPTARTRFVGVLDGMASLIAAGDRAGGGIRQVESARHAPALGSRHPADSRDGDRPVRRLCVQHRAQPPDVRYRRRPAVGLRTTVRSSARPDAR